jgi:hypothetical protein
LYPLPALVTVPSRFADGRKSQGTITSPLANHHRATANIAGSSNNTDNGYVLKGKNAKVAYEAEPPADASEFNCATTEENAEEIAIRRPPEAKLNTTATRIATKARIAPYSVMPCPDSSVTKESIKVLKLSAIKTSYLALPSGKQIKPGSFSDEPIVSA